MNAVKACARASAGGFLCFVLITAWGTCLAQTPGPVAKIVEGAKREGIVDVVLQSSLTEKGIKAVEIAIKQKYGFHLKINYTPSRVYPRIHSQALTEHKTGVTPSFDLIVNSDNGIFALAGAGAIERVDWALWLPPGTPKEIVAFKGHGLVVNTSFAGLLYDPKKVTPEKAPSSLRDLSEPRWRGQVILPPYPDTWLTNLISMGREKSLALLKEIMRNGAVVQEWPAAFTRYAAGEYPMAALISETYYHMAKLRSVPAAFKPLDVPYLARHIVGVRTAARHPNAAKLVAAFLASPDAVKIWQEVASNPNIHYPSLPQYQLGPEWQGIRPWVWNEEQLQFRESEEGNGWAKEIARVLAGRS